MANATTEAARDATRAAVAPEILAVAGEVGRPRANVRFNTDLGHLPGPGGLASGIATVAGMMLRGEAHLTSLARRHGAVFRGRVGPEHVVFVADADLAWGILKNDDRLWSSALAWRYFFGDLLPGSTGDGLLMLDFDFHRDARRLLQPAFGASAVTGYIEDASTIFEAAIDGWLRRGRVSFKREVRRMFARVSAKIFMGLEGDADVARMDRAMNDGWQAVLAMRKRTRLSLGWRRAQRGLDELWGWMRPQLDAKRASQGRDLFSHVCGAEGAAAWLDDDARMRLFILTMFGAFDTTASGAASMAHLLARHPTWQERLREEVTALGDGAGVEALKSLEQVEWVWKETLRRYPVAGQISRVALRETRLGDARIPARTFVNILAGALANDPRWWTAPERFDPERFSPARAEDKRHKATFLPFGAGAHACVGAQVANVEIKAFWRALLRRARIRLSRDRDAGHSYGPIGIVAGDVDLVVEPA